MKAEELIEHFEEQLVCLRGTNMFIAGSCALQLYGFKMDWEPGDLDVVIYHPTDHQELYLDTKFDGCSDYETDDNHGCTLRRVFEIIIDGKKLNVLCEYAIEIPEPNLTYQFYHINPVANILNAIISYKREKDSNHIKSLINLNFNERK